MSRGPCAADFAWLNEAIAFWQEYDSACRTDLSCSAHRVGDGLLLVVDPIRLAPEPTAALVERSAPRAILLTNGNHGRAARIFARRWKIPIFAAAGLEAELGFAPDEELKPGAVYWDQLEILDLSGASPGEIAIYRRDLKTLTFGDAFIHLPDVGFTLLPEKYCSDAEQLRRSIQQLRDLPVQLLTFAHGYPVTMKAEERLRALLSNP
jgi:glyoxylase-like metal-dependent hydrolase (beta-lactamase superfamily II)